MAGRYPAQLSGGQRQRVGVARALAGDPPLMLMDEPFGAIDPITRGRLQNEFLRLQGELRKTIVFVTHDIDEAIKMGDRIAVLKKGGVLAQYATPAELLLAPADDFVEDFVGADRALKRLALQRVRDVDLWKAPRVRRRRPGRARAGAGGRLRPSLPAADRRRREAAGLALGSRPAGERVPGEADAAPTPRLDRTRCSATPSPSCSRRTRSTAPVVDERGAVVGVLSIELIAQFLASEDPRELDPPDTGRGRA